VFPNLIGKLIFVKPATIIGWHRKLVKKKWDYSKRKNGRPPITDELTKLIAEIKNNNKRWGAKKIKGELRKLGISISKDTILKILRSYGFPPNSKRSDQTWLNFLRSQTSRYFACDFFTVESFNLKTLYVFIMMDVSNREILFFGVTSNPTAIWLENTVRSGFMQISHFPSHLISDRDSIYGEWYKEFLSTCYDITLFRTPPRTPNCNSFCERIIRSIREELLDQRIIYDSGDLYRLLSSYVDHYNKNRTHQGIGYDSPLTKYFENGTKYIPRYKKKRAVDGLVVEYSLAA
jgi:putative transposase